MHNYVTAIENLQKEKKGNRELNLFLPYFRFLSVMLFAGSFLIKDTLMSFM